MSENEGMSYDKSNMPPGNGAPQAEHNKRPDRGPIASDTREGWNYPSLSSAGLTEVVLPAAHGPNSEERMLVKNFGPFLAGEVEKSLGPNPFPKSFPRKSASQTLWHYIGAAKGASLMDSAAIGRMEMQAREFEKEPDQREYFEQVIKPYLHSLSPKRRR